MSPTGHLAMGFVAKRIEAQIPLWVLLIASYIIDLIYFCFLFLGLDTMAYAPWSHSLIMALVWSLLGALVAYGFSHKLKLGLILGLTIFSHWVLDFIVWKHNLLTFDPSWTMGFGLYDMIGFSLNNAGFNQGSIIATSIELSMLILGIIISIPALKKVRKEKKSS